MLFVRVYAFDAITGVKGTRNDQHREGAGEARGAQSKIMKPRARLLAG